MCVLQGPIFRHTELGECRLDEVVGSNEPSGYIGRVRRTKSAYTTELKTMLLPMVAPRLGVSGIDWFQIGNGHALKRASLRVMGSQCSQSLLTMVGHELPWGLERLLTGFDNS